MRATDTSPFGRFADRLASLSSIGPDHRAALLGLNGSVIQVPGGIDLVPPGEKARHAHFVVEGLVGRFAQFSDGKRQITAIHIPGDVADLHAVARPDVAPALQALVTTTLIRVPLDDMAALTRDMPALARAFWAYCAVDLAVLERWAASLGRRAAIQRMAHLLCEIGLRIEQSGRGSRRSFALPLTQQQLADALGLTPVHVNRTLKMLRGKGLITIRGRAYEVPDWKGLAAVGDFDPTYLMLEDFVRRAV